MASISELVLNHPANAGLRHYFEARQRPGMAGLLFPNEVERPYESLGTHPDLVARLWDELGSALPDDCRAIFFGTPALIHPQSGMVFGFAGGTHTYGLRLPEKERQEAVAAGVVRIKHYPGKQASLDLASFGDEWMFCGWFKDEERWCRAAYDFAAFNG